MNYYIQGDAANADKIKAAFEKLGYDTGNLGFTSSQLYYTIEGEVKLMCTKALQNLVKTHPDYKELELPVDWAASLGLPTRREVNAPKSGIGNVGASVCRKNVLVNKCCWICEKYKKVDACEMASSIDGFNACKLVCWDFELRKELKAD